MPDEDNGGGRTAHDDEPETQLWRGRPSQIVNLKWWLLSLLVLPLPWAIYQWLIVRNTIYELTTERLTLRTGILSRRTDSLELYRVRDTVVTEPFWFRLVGAGNIDMETSDRTHPHFELRAVKDVHRLVGLLREQVEKMRVAKRVREVDFE
jgi:uncharacterized membrane protein YdbT with pleckstrin-like domain